MRGIRRLARLYVSISSLAVAAALCGALFLVAAAVVVPEWAEQACRDVSAALAGDPESLGFARGPTRTDPPRPACLPAAPSPSPEPRAAPEPPREPVASTIDRLEVDVALMRAVPGPMTPAERAATAAARLEAWESLRGPLLSCVSRSTVGDRLPDPAGDIRTIREPIARGLGRLTRREDEGADGTGDHRGQLVARLDGRSFAHLLLDDRCLSDRDAIECLLALPKDEARAALSWLSRLDPARASRLILGLKPGSDEGGEGRGRGTGTGTGTGSGSGTGSGTGTGTGLTRQARAPELIADR